MNEAKDLEQKLKRLLKNRLIPVDEERLEGMRKRLQKGIRPGAALSVFGAFRTYRFSLAFGTALVLIALIVWQHDPLRQGESSRVTGSTFIGAMQDEEQLDDMLVLLSGFTLSSLKDRTLIDWAFYNRSFLEDEGGEELFGALYGWPYDQEES